jgi:hypothetical protein
MMMFADNHAREVSSSAVAFLFGDFMYRLLCYCLLEPLFRTLNLVAA